MKNSTASNAVVSLAAALAEVTADYEDRLKSIHGGIETLGRQLKQATDERVKAEAVIGRLLDVVDAFVDGKLASEAFMVEMKGLLRDWPWPIPTLNPVPKSNAG